MLKIDVQGANKSVLQGTAVLLSAIYLVALFLLFRGHISRCENESFHGKSSNDDRTCCWLEIHNALRKERSCVCY